MKNPIVLAFSGGLDTSYCIPWLKEKFERDVVTVSVDTGGFSPSDLLELETKALALGASKHITVDARQELFDQVLQYLIFGNVRKGELYPLSVGAERGVQAAAVGNVAATLKSDTIAHGCTAAGNDQVRFEIALRTLFPETRIVAPVRDYPVTRGAQVSYLQERHFDIPSHGAAYSINSGLWGTTIGGSETLNSLKSIPENVWPLSHGALENPKPDRNLTISFEEGIPTAVDGVTLNPVDIILELESIGSAYAIGRGVHLGDTILGIKGRVAFEAPAAELLLTSHLELEKLVLSGKQLQYKSILANLYGDLVHSGNHLDPVCRDIESFFKSSQATVSGDVFLRLGAGHFFVNGCDSPFSLMNISGSHYGESTKDWSASDAAGFCKISSVASSLQHLARSKNSNTVVTS